MLFPSTIVSPHHLEQEAGRIKELFSQKETEGTWKSFDAALLQFKSWLKQGCGNMENLLPVVRKHLVNSIILAMLSERSKLSGTGCEVVEELAINLKGDFDKLSDQLVPPLLKLCARTNKVMVQRASKTLNQIIVSCAHLKFVHKFADAMANQSKSLRVIVAGALKLLLENTHAHTITMELVAEIEKVIRLGLTDAEPAARERSRASYHLYCEYFPDRVHEFIKTLDSTTKKYLSDRTGDSGKRQPLLSSRSTPSSPEKAVAPTARVQLERPARTTGLLSLGAKPQRIINGVANQDNNINRLKESSANVLLSKPQRVTSAEMPKTAPGSTVTSPRAHLATAEGRIGTATRIAPSTPIPKHLQGRPLRVAADVKNSASIKLNGESVRVDIPETSKIESSLVVQNAELEEQHKSEAAALVIIDKPEPSIFEEDEIHERTLDKMEAIKSHEWSARVQSYLDLSEILFSKDDPSIDQELTDKIMNVFVQSLADNHFRVVKIGLDVWNRLLDERNRNTENHLVTLLPLVLTVSEDPQLRSKQEIRISTVELVEKIQKYMDPVEFINVLFYTLNAPEYSKNCRVRHGAINLLHSMIPKFKRDFFNKLTVFRMAISRLLGSVSDSEKLLMRKIREIIIEIHGVDEKTFFEAVAHFASPDRTALRNLISKGIKDYIKHEDYAMNLKKTQKSGTEKLKSISTNRKAVSLIPLVKPTAASRQNQVAKPVANKSASPTPSSSKTGTPVKSHTLLHEHETLTDDCTQTPFGAVAVDPVEVSSALSKLDKDKAEEVIRSFVDSMIAELDQTVDESEQSEVTAIESVAKPEQCNTEQLNALMESPSKQQTFVINEQASVDLKLIAQQCLDDIIVNALNMADRQQQATEQPSEQNQQSILFDEAEQLGKSLLQGDADALVRSLKTNANFWSGNQSFLLDYLLTAQRLKFHENVFAAFEKARSKAPFKQMIPMMLRYAVNVIINTESPAAKMFAERLVTESLRPLHATKILQDLQESVDHHMPHFRIYLGFLTPVLCNLLGDKTELAAFNYDLKMIDRLMNLLLQCLLNDDVAITITARESMILLTKAVSDHTNFVNNLKAKVSALPALEAQAVTNMLNHRFKVENMLITL